VWIPGSALGLGWFTADGVLYVANLMAVTPAGLLELLRQFVARYPWVGRFEADRVPGPLRRTPAAGTVPSARRCYDGRTLLRLARFAHHRAEARRPRFRQPALLAA
jgi:hypothetical protein